MYTNFKWTASPRISRQHRLRSACTSAQSDQGLCCPLRETLEGQCLDETVWMWVSTFCKYTHTFLHDATKLHISLIITQFIRTRFWILHGSKTDPKNVKTILKNDHKWSFFYIIFTFFVWIQHGCLTNTVYALDPNNSVIKRLWCTM